MDKLRLTQDFITQFAKTVKAPSKPSDDLSPYLLFDVRTGYDRDSGVIGVPIAKSDTVGATAIRVIKTRAANTKKNVEFVIVRLGKKPLIPSPISDSSNVTLARMVIVPHAPALTTFGVFVYAVSGLYEYVIKTTQGLTQTLMGPMCPADSLTDTFRSVTKDQFNSDIGKSTISTVPQGQ